MAILTELKEESSSSSSSISSTNYIYDVFLSFRGEDTRYNFTDHLHKALIEADLSTFLDDCEIETGEELKPELERAIEASRASIIVLSKNYAFSTWCLDELVMILHRRKTYGHMVLPVFYHVEPSDVRKQRNSFGEAFDRHGKSMEMERDESKRRKIKRKMKMWKKALSEVADLKAMVAHGHETKFIQEIVAEIMRRQDHKVLGNAPHFIGMEFEVEAINSWVQNGSSNVVDILAICGMSGIGKTTLAKYIYDFNFQRFERRSFLEDIARKSVQNDGILGLQKQLLANIRKRRFQDVFHTNQGTTLIEKALITKRVLLILDDVDDVDQLNSLLGTIGFYPGSKIIITTKDKLLPQKCEVFNLKVPSKSYTEHLLEGLRWDEALELLSWHAFRCNHPKEGYEEHSRHIIQYCGGHPLALKVLGGSLFGRDVDAWEDTLKLLKIESNTHIQNVLKISYESLESKNDKELFKHIACFFVGKDKDFTEEILKECDVKTSSGIANLVDRCFLTISSLNELMMHRLLQEMGRAIVHQESPEKPWKRSRLWNHDDSFNVLKEEKGTEKIRGLILDMQILNRRKLPGYTSAKKRKYQDFLRKSSLPQKFKDHVDNSRYMTEVNLKTDAFKRMNNLAILHLYFVRLDGSYENFPKNIKWLCWHGFPLKHIPSELPMENLVALDLSHSNLKRLWKTPKWLGSLKILDLSCSLELVRTPDFCGFPDLERLILARCISLVKISKSIGDLDRLVLLDLRHCESLKKLPNSMGKLKRLKSLLIEGCSKLGKFQIDMRNLKSLEELNATNICTNAQASTEVVLRSPGLSIVSLPHSLVRLNLAGNNLRNASFPMDFGSLPLLKELDLSANRIKSLPNCIRNLKGLVILDLDDCKELKSVLCPPTSVKRLFIDGCTSLEKVTFHSASSSTLPFVKDGVCSDLLTHVEGKFKLESMATVDKRIIKSFGWSNFPFTTNTKMLYEFGIFSTFFPGKVVPNWAASDHRMEGSSISFKVPNKNLRIQGLNVCFVLAFVGTMKRTIATIKIKNISKNLTWVYVAYEEVVQENDEEMVFLSHWKFGNELEQGNEVNVIIGEREGVRVKECGISFTYDNVGKEEADLSCYSWKHTINGGGDLSAFQLTTGAYLLVRDRFSMYPYIIENLRNDTSMRHLLGGFFQFKDQRSWAKVIGAP